MDIARLIRYMLLIPRISVAFKKMIKASCLSNFKWTQEDSYWASLRTDYNFWGMDKDQRSGIYKQKPKEFNAK